MNLRKWKRDYIVNFDTKILSEKNKKPIIDFLDEEQKKEYIAAVVNDELVSLNTPVCKKDEIKLVETFSNTGRKIYADTVCLIFMLATNEIIPECKVNIEYSIGSGIYITADDNQFNQEILKKIEQEMYKIVRDKIDLNKEKVSKNVAITLFNNKGYTEKVELINSLNPEYVDLYLVDDKLFTFDNVLAANTSLTPHFKLINYYPGVILMIAENSQGKIPPFKEQVKISKIFSVSRKWTDTMDVSYAGKLNQYVLSGKMDYLIKVNETYYNNQLAHCAQKIINQEDLNIILIAGPSSSGKTTTAEKLAIQLGVYGKKTIVISSDDYFIDRDKTPINEMGIRDFESLEAIDLRKLNNDLLSLLEGNEIELPKYNFLTGKSEKSGRFVKFDDNHMIIIEGIHCLNPKLSALVPDKNKYKIYVSALTQVNIDSHNRISTSDSRLIRRIVRDENFRGHDCEKTLAMWENVRKGERKYIFPFQENADFYMDTSLVYEFNVLRDHALKHLKKIDTDSKYYVKSRQLIKLLNNFLSLKNTKIIPRDSILREFIGGNV